MYDLVGHEDFVIGETLLSTWKDIQIIIIKKKTRSHTPICDLFVKGSSEEAVEREWVFFSLLSIRLFFM